MAGESSHTAGVGRKLPRERGGREEGGGGRDPEEEEPEEEELGDAIQTTDPLGRSTLCRSNMSCRLRVGVN